MKKYTLAFDEDMQDFSILNWYDPYTKWDWNIFGLIIGPYYSLNEALKTGQMIRENFRKAMRT